MKEKFKVESSLRIGSRTISRQSSTYFIADIAANHDGNLERAKELIYLAKEHGADAAKFQHFKAETIVSDRGFKDLGNQLSHQSKWKKSVFETYQDASLNFDWTHTLKETCDRVGIHFFTSPYSIELIDKVDPFIPAYKIGSGDITWLDAIDYIAKKGKPTFIATGASELNECILAVNKFLESNGQIAIMQCNTNYTASVDNFKYINLNVLKMFNLIWPEMILGLSDHTPGHSTVLGAIALGARVMEKHFTDDNSRMGPDHKFSMDPKAWGEMIQRSRELENALGDGIKRVEENEKDTVCLQRRAIRASRDLGPGDVVSSEAVEYLRPCPEDAIAPYDLCNVVGKKINQKIEKGTHIKWEQLT